MPPDDPMGRKGPNLDDFLRKRPLGPENKKSQCPYGKEKYLNTCIPNESKNESNDICVP